MKTSILTTVFLFLELIVLVIIATNGIWGVSEVGERNIYLIFAVFIWIFGTIGLRKVSANFLRPTMLTLGLLVLTSQVQVAHDLLPLKVAGVLLVNQLILCLFRNKNLDHFIDILNIYLCILVWRSFGKNNTDVQYFFIFSKDIAVKSIIPTLGLLFCYLSINKLATVRIFRKLLLMLVIVGITGVSLVVTLPYNYRHHSFFLGPLLKISSGGTMLVDTYSQYGAGLFYFLLLALKAVNLGVTYTGLGFVTSIFQVLSFFGLFIICYSVFRKNLSLAILITGIAILSQFYLAIGVPTFFPSTGVFRFGLTYILAASFIVSGKYLKGWLGQIYAGLIVGIAAVWSFDILTSTLYVFVAIQLLDFLENKSLIRIIRAFVLLGVSTAAVIGLFVLFTFLRSGFLPNIVPYLAYLKLYAAGYNLLPVPAFGVWWLFLVVYAVSAIWSCSNLKTDSARAVFLITAVGVGILPYYVGRSHPNNLFHVGLPFLFLTGFWIWKNRYIRIVGVVLLCFFVAYEITFNIDSIKEKFATTVLGLPHGTATEAISNAASRDKDYWYSRLPALKGLDLTKVKSVSTLLPYDRATGILSLLGKNNLATVTGDPEEDLFAWSALKPLVLK